MINQNRVASRRIHNAVDRPLETTRIPWEIYWEDHRIACCDDRILLGKPIRICRKRIGFSAKSSPQYPLNFYRCIRVWNCNTERVIIAGWTIRPVEVKRVAWRCIRYGIQMPNKFQAIAIWIITGNLETNRIGFAQCWIYRRLARDDPGNCIFSF